MTIQFSYNVEIDSNGNINESIQVNDYKIVQISREDFNICDKDGEIIHYNIYYTEISDIFEAEGYNEKEAEAISNIINDKFVKQIFII